MNLKNIWYCFFIFLTSGLSFPSSDSVDGLKKTADHDFLWLLIATGLVAIGLLFEVGEVCRELKKWWKARGRKRSWIPVMSAVGFLLVTIGVVGEGIFEGKLGIADTSIREKDEKTAQDAGDAAARAQQSAQAAVEDAVLAKGSADSANKEAGKAQQKARDVKKQADELNRELLAAKTQLATVDAKRAELEKSLVNLAVCNAPRVIRSWFTSSDSAAKSYVDPLRPMAGQMVFIEVVPDEEARRAAFNIAGTLADARWDVQKPIKFVDGLADGVSLQTSFPVLTGDGIPNMVPSWHARDVAEKLRDFLHSYYWQAVIGLPLDAQGKIIHDEKIFPMGAIRIQIGLYPPTMYVNPPGQEELTSRLEEIKREREKFEAESKRRREEHWARLPPQDRERLEQADEEWEAKMRNESSNSPCQVLNPLL